MNSSALRAYHGDPAIKTKYIDRIKAHRAAEHLVQGIGWEDDDGTVRGCAVGCMLEDYDHKRYPVELGLPVWLAHLEDAIFEGLPASEAQAWPESFLEAIHPGADLECVRHQLALLRIDRLIALQTGNSGKHGAEIDAVIAQTIDALRQVRRCHEAEIGGNVCDLSAARSAAESAWSAESAARSAESAARSAAESAWSAESAARSAESAARSAAWSAESAARSAAESAWSAESAARSAESAARSAAWSARSAESAESAWKQEAADLLKLLREATV